MYNYYNPAPMNYTNQIIGKQVTGIEEAKAFIIDPFNTYLFMDLSAGKIYMKRMNNNGLSDFYIFENKQTKISDPLENINKRLTEIETKMESILNVQSDGINLPANAKSKPAIISESSADDERKK